MIAETQIKNLEELLGRALRLSISIEFTINCIYCFVKTADIPILYQGKNLDIYENTRFTKQYKKAEHANFDKSLRELQNLDKECKIFTSKQYSNLNQIRIERNKLFHETTCPYLLWKSNNDEIIKEYNKDIKQIKHFISIAQQYDTLTKHVLDQLIKF